MATLRGENIEFLVPEDSVRNYFGDINHLIMGFLRYYQVALEIDERHGDLGVVSLLNSYNRGETKQNEG